MTPPISAVYRYIVRELAPSEQEPDAAPVTIVCEPLLVPGGRSSPGTITLHLAAGTTPEEAWTIAGTLQAKVKGLCHLQTPADAAK